MILGVVSFRDSSGGRSSCQFLRIDLGQRPGIKCGQIQIQGLERSGPLAGTGTESIAVPLELFTSGRASTGSSGGVAAVAPAAPCSCTPNSLLARDVPPHRRHPIGGGSVRFVRLAVTPHRPKSIGFFARWRIIVIFLRFLHIADLCGVRNWRQNISVARSQSISSGNDEDGGKSVATFPSPEFNVETESPTDRGAGSEATMLDGRPSGPPRRIVFPARQLSRQGDDHTEAPPAVAGRQRDL